MENNTNISAKQRKKPGRIAWKKGQSGNPLGRPRKPEIELLRVALEQAKKQFGMGFLEHFVRRAYKNDNVAIALGKKLIPDKIQGEGFGTEIFSIIQRIQQDFIQGNCKPSLELDSSDGMDTGRTR